MNKKILIVSILAVLVLVSISFASAITTNTKTTNKKESPLFGIRIKQVVGERLQNLKENIKARFIGERIFFLPLFLNEKPSLKQQLGNKGIISFNTECEVFTCVGHGC